MVEGTFAHPSMADTIPMRATEAARGHGHIHADTDPTFSAKGPLA
jgi:hypothetical protein